MTPRAQVLALPRAQQKLHIHRSLVLWAWISLSAVVLVALSSVSASAQQREELKIPEPEPVTLTTKDGVTIKATYYPGGFYATQQGEKRVIREMNGKEVVPIILVHGYEGNRNVYDQLATYLQSLGHAVIAPDLRGHGRSTVRQVGTDEQELEADKLNKNDFMAMAQDVATVKKFLLDKNNEGKLNIELLCVVGADLGSIVAMNWAVYDWSRPILPAVKLGKDVKALVLLSPPQSFKGLTTRDALRHPIVRGALSTMIVVGREDRESYSDAKRLFNTLERYHAEIPTDPQERMDKQDLFFIEAPTSLQSTKLLHPRLPIMGNIASFIAWRLVNKKGGYPWTDRTNPLSE